MLNMHCWMCKNNKTEWKFNSIYTHTHTHPFNGPLSGTTRVSRYQKGETNLDFTEARDSEWQWHQLGHMQVCTSLQTDNHTSTHCSVFYRPDALPAAQPTVSKHTTISKITSKFQWLLGKVVLSNFAVQEREGQTDETKNHSFGSPGGVRSLSPTKPGTVIEDLEHVLASPKRIVLPLRSA